ncbi:MAG: hypothetical protein AB1Z55_03690 [Acidimicrobiia bacterium]
MTAATPDGGSAPAAPSDRSPSTLGVSGSALSATWAWLTLGAALIVLGAVVVTGFAARAIVLDVVALWPIGAAALVVVPVAIVLGRRVPVLWVVIPLLLLTWVLGGVAWFLADGPGGPPSRAADLVGPTVDPELGTLEVAIDGTLTIAPIVDAAYAIAPALVGGDVGPPESFDALDDGALSIVTRVREAAGWYESAGWRLGLRPGPVWTLSVVADRIDADLGTIAIDRLDVAGDGVVRLGVGSGAVSQAGGTLTIVIPPDTAASVVGPATVPDTWTPTADGAAAPVAGDGYRIEVLAGSLTIEEAGS